MTTNELQAMLTDGRFHSAAYYENRGLWIYRHSKHGVRGRWPAGHFLNGTPELNKALAILKYPERG